MFPCDPSDRLQAKLQAACGAADVEPCAAFWQLIVQDSWYQENLDKCARRALRRAHSPQAWIGDLKQDAMLLLVRQLRRSLGKAGQQTNLASPGWLLAATRGHCQEALCRMQAKRGHFRQFFEDKEFAQWGK